MEHLKIPAHGISIHALLAESDISVFWTALSRPLFLSTLSLRRATNLKNTASRCRGYFYPRSPCGERRLSYFYIIKITQFLSTLSLRRATIPDREPAAGYLISIHALLAESDPTRWAPTCRISNFYPRSPCGERPSLLYSSSCIHRFLSTLSLRRATKQDRQAM